MFCTLASCAALAVPAGYEFYPDETSPNAKMYVNKQKAAIFRYEIVDLSDSVSPGETIPALAVVKESVVRRKCEDAEVSGDEVTAVATGCNTSGQLLDFIVHMEGPIMKLYVIGDAVSNEEREEFMYEFGWEGDH